MLRPLPKNWQDLGIEAVHYYLHGGDLPNLLLFPFFPKTFWEGAEVFDLSITRYVSGMDGLVVLSKTHPGICIFSSCSYNNYIIIQRLFHKSRKTFI